MARINIDLRFVELEHELLSLSEYRDVFERELQQISRQERERLHAESYSSEMDEADWQIASGEGDFLVEEVLPRFFRGPYLISLWAVFESGTIEIADYLAKRKQLRLGLRDIRGQNHVDQCKKYFAHVANYPLNWDDGILRGLGRVDKRDSQITW